VREHITECLGEIVHDYDVATCPQPPVAVAVDPDGLWVPVCARHVRGRPVVPLQEVLDTLSATSGQAEPAEAAEPEQESAPASSPSPLCGAVWAGQCQLGHEHICCLDEKHRVHQCPCGAARIASNTGDRR